MLKLTTVGFAAVSLAAGLTATSSASAVDWSSNILPGASGAKAAIDRISKGDAFVIVSGKSGIEDFQAQPRPLPIKSGRTRNTPISSRRL